MTDIRRKVGDDLRAERGMRDFRMELDAVPGFRGMRDRGEGGTGRCADDDKVLGWREEFIAVGHPYLEFGRKGVEEGVDVL